MRRRWISLWVFVALTGVALSQNQTPPGLDRMKVQTPHLLDPMKRALVEPVMALHYAQAIGLSKQQKAYIEREIGSAEAKFRSLEGNLQRERRSMEQTLSRPETKEDDALAQLDRILNIEREIKRVNMACAIRVRNHLTPAQREQLQGLRVPPPPPPPPPPPHAPAPPPTGGPAIDVPE